MHDLRNDGVGPETVTQLVREGVVERVARGAYRLVDATPDPRFSLAAASARVPKGVIYPMSALRFHDAAECPWPCGLL